MSQPKTSGLAIAALVTGLMGLGLIPIILGHVALSGIKKSNGTVEGKGFAIAGLVLGYLSLLAALIVIGLAVAIGLSSGVLKESQDAAAEAKLQYLRTSLYSYHVQARSYPTTEQGLEALVSRPVDLRPTARWQQTLDQIPNDPWGRPLQYELLPEGTSFEIWSMGPDGVSGTKDDLRLAAP